MKKLKKADKEITLMYAGFIGALNNMLILENTLVKQEKIRFEQYVNYLSQIAFCIELGMKSIALIKDDTDKTHNLRDLYNEMPEPFRRFYEKTATIKTLYGIKTTDESIEKIANVYTEFRYMSLNNMPLFLLNDSFDPANSIVIFSKASNHQNIRFLTQFVAILLGFYNHMEKSIDIKSMFKDCPKMESFSLDIPDSVINEYNNATNEYCKELENKMFTL
jgi:hypothetical protein